MFLYRRVRPSVNIYVGSVIPVLLLGSSLFAPELCTRRAFRAADVLG
jgi:hypothetical protein